MATARESRQDEMEGDAEPVEAGGESMESLLAQQDALASKLTHRKVTWVKVISVTKEHVLVDIGEKREGLIPLSDFAPAGPPARGAAAAAAAQEDLPTAGQRIPVILSGGGRGDGPAQLSYKRARAELSWDAVVKAHAEKARVRGRVVSAIKGGFLVDVGGVSAFLPASLADLRPVRDPKRMLGTGVRCVIVELNEAKKQIVISRKAVLDEENAKRRSKLLAELRVGEVRIGRVLGSSPAGVTVDIGGAEGFVRAADLVWGVPKEPPKIERGAKVRVKVLAKPAEGEKVALGIKQLSANPADAIRKKYPPKTFVKGKVVSAGPAGVRVTLDNGTAALVPPAESGDAASAKPGEPVSAVVVGVDPNTFELLVSVEKYNDIQDRKRVASYLKTPPPLTLGQLLSPEKSEE